VSLTGCERWVRPTLRSHAHPIRAGLGQIDAEVLQKRLGIEGFILLHRALHRLLLDALNPGTVQVACEVVDVGPNLPGDAAEVTYLTASSQETSRADLVVAADGINSRIRA
jgi:2-polyprenyl-6-methoxyphenol hydroxylase-like FAD-dependent oxidoreductase